MNCKHPSFDINQHDYCPDCGETDTYKVIDGRYIATLEAEIEKLEALLMRVLVAHRHQLRQRLLIEISAALKAEEKWVSKNQGGVEFNSDGSIKDV